MLNILSLSSLSIVRAFLPLFDAIDSSYIVVLDWNNTQNGKLIGSVGIISALVQGGYVRRAMSKVGEGVIAKRGVSSCVAALVFLAILPIYANKGAEYVAVKLLQAAAVCMAFTSATVVNSLTAFASLQCDEPGIDEATGKPVEEHPDLVKGKALGRFRSAGQLGRAIGPILGMFLFPIVLMDFLKSIYSLRIVLDYRA